MKQWLKSIFFVGLVSLAFGFVSCAADSGDSTETQPQVQVQTTYYTVSFNSNGGSSVSAQKVESGKTATKPSNPIKEGYSFRGWYNGTSEFDFSTPIKSNITLTAQWTENKTTPETPQNPDTPENPDSPDNPSTPTVTTYTVTFKANGGTGGDTTQTVTFGTTATLTANTFTRTGYTFLGWAKTANAEQIEYADKAEFTTPEQNTTLYALWKPNEYTLTFRANGGTGDDTTQTVTFGTTATLSSNTFTYAGYRFASWNTKADGTGNSYSDSGDFTVSEEKNITLYAQWVENDRYIISYANTRGATNTNPTSYRGIEGATLSDLSLTGYIFEGWYSEADADGNGTGTKITGWGANEKSGDITLYAKWKANSYTITFSANNGTGARKSQTVTFGTSANLDSNSFEYTGYRFAGWNTAQDGSGSSYSDGGDFSVTETSDITLYAQWVENDRYIISYANTRGATNTNPTSYRGIEGATLSDLSLTGYIFEGWYSEADADGNGTGTKITGWGANEKSGDITLYAKWKANSYTITFSANNGTGARKSQTVTFGTSANLDSNSFEYTGYRFAGWNTAQDGSGSSYSDGGDFSVTETSDITLYAQWVENDRYIISYANTRGATNTNPTSYRGIEGATLSDLSLTGYIFEGWYSEADADGNGTGTKITGWGANEKTGDVTLWAKWTPRTDTAYKVEHWQENANDDSYTLFESENMSGTTDAQTNAEEKTYAHFTALAITQETIAGNGSTVVKVYYERKRVTLTLNLDGGTLDGESGTVTKTGKYGQTVAIANPTKTGFAFAGWNENDGTLPTPYTEDAEYTAVWSTAKIVSFTVNEESDISVGRLQEGNTVTFTADECDSYAWYFNDAKVATTRQYEIELSTLAKGTYGLALEAQKESKLYSYFTQIKVEN